MGTKPVLYTSTGWGRGGQVVELRAVRSGGGGRWRGGKKHAVKPLGSLKRLTITTTTPRGRQSDGKAPPANHGLRRACAPAEASARRGARQIEASRWPPCAPTRPIASMHLSGLRTLVASIDQRGQCIGIHLRASLLFDAPLLAAQRSTRFSRSAEGSNLGASTQLTNGMKSPAATTTAHERPGGRCYRASK